MKKTLQLIMLIFFVGAISTASFAQDEKLERPKDIGFEKIDAWVNQCYDLYDESLNTQEKLDAIDATFAAFEEDAANVTDDGKANLKNNLDAVKAKNKEMNAQMTSLMAKSEDMTKAAKEVTPKTKIPKAAKHVKSGLKALNAAKANIPDQTKKIAAQTAKAADYVK